MLKTGRQGYLGLGIESTPGTAVPATTTIPFTANTLLGKHTPQEDIAARASRVQDFNSAQGKMWGEGQIDVNVDSLNVGFLLKIAMGNEIVNTVQTGVYDHLFYTTVSGNQPTTATLYNYQGIDVQQFPSMAVDKFELDVKDGFMTAKVGFKGFHPTAGSYSPVTVSGTLFNFSDYVIKLGATINAAAVASAKPITEFNLQINNNAEVIHESGSSRASRIFWKQLKINGSFMQYFETITERDNYYNMNKSALVLTASGISLPGSNTELLTINIAKMVYTDAPISTGLENYFAIRTSFTAEIDPAQAKQLDVVLRNYRSTAYS